jgi:hypothetical protein
MPRICNAVRNGRDEPGEESSIDAAIDEAIERHAANPVVRDKVRNGADFETYAEEAVAHRESLAGFLRPHQYDEDHNKTVAYIDEVFTFETRHTRKNGYAGSLLHEEKYVPISVTSGLLGLGLSLDEPSALALTAGSTPLVSHHDEIFNEPYRRAGHQADQVWDAYVERRDYEEDHVKPHKPFRYSNMIPLPQAPAPSLKP